MKIKKYKIGINKIELISYTHEDYSKERDTATKARPTLLICPGGGYAFHSIIEEDTCLSFFYDQGYNIAILHYSINEELEHSTPESEVAEAIALINRNKEELQHNGMLGIIGFSAGGHVATSYACHWQQMNATPPTALLLCYPVITMGKYTHQGSYKKLSKTPNFSKEYYSLETQVSNKMVPTFIWHTVNDELVNIKNTLLFFTELINNHIPVEYHVFEKGVHGLANSRKETGNENTNVQEWQILAANWLRQQMSL